MTTCLEAQSVDYMISIHGREVVLCVKFSLFGAGAARHGGEKRFPWWPTLQTNGKSYDKRGQPTRAAYIDGPALWDGGQVFVWPAGPL